MIKKLYLIVLLALIGSGLKAQEADAIVGNWQIPEQQAQIHVVRDGDVYEGKLTHATVTLKNSISLSLPAGWLGIYILRNVMYDKPNHWHGLVYNPEDKKMYTCKLELKEDGRLKLRAYKGIPLLGKTVYLEKLSM
ncbi:hypothetical protein GCM10027037_08170 [Mucilaginibacter koreensis]